MKKLLSFLMGIAVISTVSCSEKQNEIAESSSPHEEINVTQVLYKEEYAEFPEDHSTTEGLGYVEGSGIKMVYMDKDGNFKSADYDENAQISSTKELFSGENVFLNAFNIDENGSISAFIVYVKSDGDMGSEEYFDNAEISFELKKISPEGNAESFEISGLDEYFTLKNDIIEDIISTGENYILKTNNGIFKISGNGEVTDAKQLTDSFHLGIDADGKIIAAARKGYAYLDENSLDIPDELTEYGNYLMMMQGVATGHDGFKAFFMLNNGIFGLTDDGQVIEVMNYNKSLMYVSDYFDIVYAGKGRFMAVGVDSSKSHTVLSVMNVRPDGYVMNRQDITLGCIGYTSDAVNELSASYNKKSDSYTAKTKNYSDFDGLKTDILSGNSPDFCAYQDAEYMNKLTNIGAAADMYKLSEKYGGFKKEDVMDNIIKAYEYKGGLHMMSMDFAICAPLGSRKMFDKSLMSVDEFVDVVNNMPEGMYFANAFGNNTPEDVFQWACIDAVKNWVDFDKAECYFDTPDFVALLNMTKNIPLLPEPDYEEFETNYDPVEYDIFQNEEYSRLKNGTALISNQNWLHSALDVQNSLYNWHQNIAFEDVIAVYPPAPDPSGLIYANGFYFSVFDSGNCTEGGWDFANYILSEKILSTYSGTENHFTTMKKNFDEHFDKLRKEAADFYKRHPEEVDSDYFPYWHDISPEEEQFCRDAAAHSTVLYQSYHQLTSILSEEFAEFSAGEINAETCAERIQNRVTIYLSENS